MTKVNIWCRLGVHHSVWTGQYEKSVIMEGLYGSRTRLYPIEKCVRCGKESRDEISPPIMVGALKEAKQ